jgi:hypothetical protein
MEIGESSTKSGSGSASPLPAPAPSCTRKYPPASSVTAGSSVSWPLLAPKSPVPVALAYCSDLPPSSTPAVPRLKISMKSCVYGAPELPPPP